MMSNDSTERCLFQLWSDVNFLRAEPYIPGIIGIGVSYMILFGIGILATVLGKRKRKTLKEGTTGKEHAMLADRNIGAIVGFFSVTATFVDGAYISGTAETVFNPIYGLVWIQAPLFVCFGFWLNIAFAVKMKKAGYTTLLDPFELRYGVVHYAFIFIVMLINDMLWNGTILVSLGTSLSVIIGVNYLWAVVLSGGITTLYTVIGGLYPVVYTDVVQVLMVLVGVVVPIPFALQNSAVTDISMTAHSANSWLGELNGPLIAVYTDIALLFIFSSPTFYIYYMRIFALKTSTQGVAVVTFLAGLAFMVLGVPSIIIGAIAHSTDWNQTDYKYFGEIPVPVCDYAMALPMVLRFLTPKAVGVIGLAAVSAAAMSSLDSTILGNSVMFANNIYPKLRNSASKLFCKQPVAPDTEVVWIMRITALIFGTASVAIALTANSIYGLYIFAFDMAYCVVFPQLVCMLYIPFTNLWGAVPGFWIAILLRLLTGEPLINLPSIIKFPLYDEEYQMQMFPFRTFITMIQFIVILCLSALARQVCGADNPRCGTTYKVNQKTEAEKYASIKVNKEFQNSNDNIIHNTRL